MANADQRAGASTGWLGFAAAEKAAGATNDDLWHQILAVGLDFLLARQAECGTPGAEPACVYCYRVFQPPVHRNRLNRYYCDDCDTFIRTMPGFAEVEMPTLCVDIRGSTQIKKEVGARWIPLIRRYRRDIGLAIQKHSGFVMNTAGDAVFAIYPPGFIPLSQMSLEERQAEGAAERLKALAAGNAIATAVELSNASPTDFDGTRFPYGTAVHTAATLVFSVAGPDDFDDFSADEGAYDEGWAPADPAAAEAATGPVAIDIAGDGIVAANELASAAPAAEWLISRETDLREGNVRADDAYESLATKAGEVRVRRS